MGGWKGCQSSSIYQPLDLSVGQREDGVMDSGSEGGYSKMGEQGSKGQGSTALPNQGMKRLFHCRTKADECYFAKY